MACACTSQISKFMKCYTAVMTSTATPNLGPSQVRRIHRTKRSGPSDPRRIEVHDTVHILNLLTGLPERYTVVPAPLAPNADETWIDEDSPLGSALIGGRRGEDVAFPALGAVFRYRVIEVMSPPRLRPVASASRQSEQGRRG